MARYLMITEEVEIFITPEVTEDDKIACDDGILNIIDIETLTEYYKDEWHDIKEWPQAK